MSFSETFTGPFSLTSASPYTVGIFANTGPGSGTRTGVYPGPFTANYNFSALLNTAGYTWNSGYNGTFTATISGMAIGFPGGNLTGTMDVTLLDSLSDLRFKGTAVPFTLNSNGIMSFSLAGFSGDALQNTVSMSVTSGTFTQTPGTTPTPTPSTYTFSATTYSQFNSTATSSSTYSHHRQRLGLGRGRLEQHAAVLHQQLHRQPDDLAGH